MTVRIVRDEVKYSCGVLLPLLGSQHEMFRLSVKFAYFEKKIREVLVESIACICIVTAAFSSR